MDKVIDRGVKVSIIFVLFFFGLFLYFEARYKIFSERAYVIQYDKLTGKADLIAPIVPKE
jgi:hypothetical protein